MKRAVFLNSLTCLQIPTGAARLNFGVYYLPLTAGQQSRVPYRQPPAVLAQYLRQNLLNGSYFSNYLTQQVRSSNLYYKRLVGF